LKRDLFYIAIAVFIIWFLGRCAKMPGNIAGGPKDETPPVFLYSIPPLNSVHFSPDAKRIDMFFDEYVQLKDVNNQFVSSSPMKKKPEILLYGKKVRINLKESLLPDMTYTFYFGEAIVDNNEANKLLGFLYVLSTGDHIDSLTYTGRVVNAFDLKSRKKDDKVPVSVLLFKDFSDSAVYKSAPVYVTRTDNYGFFTFSNIRPDTFRIFAIRDMGDNLLFDMPTETIAFADSTVIIDERYYRDPDIPFPNSLNLPDSVKEKNPELPHRDITLYQFQETPTKQWRMGYERPQANLLTFAYSLPVDSLPIRIISDSLTVTGSWYVPEPSDKRDTLHFWLTDTALVKQKTLLVQVWSPRTDSTGQVVSLSDTLKMSFEPPKTVDKRSRKERRKDEKEGKNIKPRTPVEMTLITANVKDKMDLTARFQLTASQPIQSIDRSKIIFTEKVDTLEVPVPFTVAEDTSNMRKCFIDWELKEDAKYSMIIDTMAFTSIYNVFNDSTGWSFTTQKKDYYSSIEISFNEVPCPFVVQILQGGDKENVVKEALLTDKKPVLIDFLKPDKYKLKVIFDRNGNGKWDTGHYLNRVQPEKVEYYTEEVETKSNWKTEIRWTLSN
jgi:hypothetical protein